MFTKLLVFVLICVIAKSAAQTRFRCYSCGFSTTDTDRTCLTITNSTRIVECRQTYCTIMRQEFLDPSSTVASFTRGCEGSPAFLNHEVTDSTFRTFYRACTDDLCNIGDGIQSVTGGSLSPYPPFNGTNLLVPGTRSSASIVHINLMTIPLIIAVYMLG